MGQGPHLAVKPVSYLNYSRLN